MKLSREVELVMQDMLWWENSQFTLLAHNRVGDSLAY